MTGALLLYMLPWIILLYRMILVSVILQKLIEKKIIKSLNMDPEK